MRNSPIRFGLNSPRPHIKSRRKRSGFYKNPIRIQKRLWHPRQLADTQSQQNSRGRRRNHANRQYQSVGQAEWFGVRYCTGGSDEPINIDVIRVSKIHGQPPTRCIATIQAHFPAATTIAAINMTRRTRADRGAWIGLSRYDRLSASRHATRSAIAAEPRNGGFEKLVRVLVDGFCTIKR